MSEFRVIEMIPAAQYWEYIVEAESEEAAVDMILKGDVKPTEAWTEIVEDDSTFEVYRSDNE